MAAAVQQERALGQVKRLRIAARRLDREQAVRPGRKHRAQLRRTTAQDLVEAEPGQPAPAEEQPPRLRVRVQDAVERIDEHDRRGGAVERRLEQQLALSNLRPFVL